MLENSKIEEIRTELENGRFNQLSTEDKEIALKMYEDDVNAEFEKLNQIKCDTVENIVANCDAIVAAAESVAKKINHINLGWSEIDDAFAKLDAMLAEFC